MIRYLFFDMDGTIVKSDGTISERTIQVVKATNLPFSFVTARSPMEMTVAQPLLQPNAIHVCYNGAMIYQVQSNHQYNILNSITISPNDAKQFLQTLRTQLPNVALSFYDEGAWYTDQLSPEIDYEIQLSGLTPILLDSFERVDAWQADIYKIMITCFEADEMERVKRIIEQLAMHHLTVQQASEYYLEITNSAAQKATGVQFIKHAFGLKKEELCAFGDGQNDISMFEEVGMAIAMGNAMSEVKTVADYITKSNDEDGIAYAIEQFFQYKK